MNSKTITSIFYFVASIFFLIVAIREHKTTYYLFSSCFFIFGITNIGLDVKKDKTEDDKKDK